MLSSVLLLGGGSRQQHAQLRFGPIAIGTTVEKCMEVINMSSVSVQFRIERMKQPSSLEDDVFFCTVTQAEAPAYGKLQIPVQFAPHIVGAESVDYFSVVPVGSIIRSVLKVTGSCLGMESCAAHLSSAQPHLSLISSADWQKNADSYADAFVMISYFQSNLYFIFETILVFMVNKSLCYSSMLRGAIIKWFVQVNCIISWADYCSLPLYPLWVKLHVFTAQKYG
ncbi:uncharacterized protein LOC115082029 [Rhinatrema bivittatum]|uniref:uncharacterized protein LOC115082029 n=1 Tax=Rhinatrema bivittatum TaxID=194408 RepID=UPI0011294FA1|nr:uncharacterized protein LOC115082029 [Rhinatrema bivittatum]